MRAGRGQEDSIRKMAAPTSLLMGRSVQRMTSSSNYRQERRRMVVWLAIAAITVSVAILGIYSGALSRIIVMTWSSESVTECPRQSSGPSNGFWVKVGRTNP